MTDDDDVRRLLDANTIAVVGSSTTPEKPAHYVPAYLLDHGYDVIPVNPMADEIFGRPAYDSLADVDAEIDLVNVFRPSEEIPTVVDSVLELDDEPGIWIQLGIRNDQAVERAREAGLTVVQDRCIKVEHGKRMG